MTARQIRYILAIEESSARGRVYSHSLDHLIPPFCIDVQFTCRPGAVFNKADEKFTQKIRMQHGKCPAIL